MVHAIIYLGSLEVNFPSLAAATDTYRDARGGEHAPRQPSRAVNGIVFARMQRGNQEFVVRADDVVLETPVLLVPARHSDGKGYGPNPTSFGSRSARQLLADIADANPTLRDRVGALLNRLEPVTGTATSPGAPEPGAPPASAENARPRDEMTEGRASSGVQEPRLLRCTRCDHVQPEGVSTSCGWCGGPILQTGVPFHPTPPSVWSGFDARAVMGLLVGVGLVITCVSALRSEPRRPRVSPATVAAVRSFYDGYEFGGGWHMTSFGVDGDLVRVGVTIPNGDDYREDPPPRVEGLVRGIACVGAIRGKAVWRQIPEGQGVEIVALTPAGSVLAAVTCPRQYGDD